MEKNAQDEVHVTQSEIATFNTCRRKWELRYQFGLVKKGPPPAALLTGTDYHNALQFITHLRHQPEAALAMAKNFHGRDQDPASVERLRAMLVGFVKYLLPSLAKLNGELNTECDFVIPPSKGFHLNATLPGGEKMDLGIGFKGRLDGCIIDTDAKHITIIEHKTASRLDNTLVDALERNHQLMFIAMAASLSYPGYTVSFLYTVARKPSIKMHGGETEEEYAARDAERRVRGEYELEDDYQKRIKRLRPIKRKVPEKPSEYAERLAKHVSADDYMLVPIALPEPRVHDAANSFAPSISAMGTTFVTRGASRKLVDDGRIARVSPANFLACYTPGIGKCPYFDLCNAIGGGNPQFVDSVLQEEYMEQAPYTELADDGMAHQEITPKDEG